MFWLVFFFFGFFLLQGMWDPSSQPGIEPTSPALEGEVLTTGPPGKSHDLSVLILHLSGLGQDSINRWMQMGKVGFLDWTPKP